jgi:3-hydroxyacyl-CoA dehydrogenase
LTQVDAVIGAVFEDLAVKQEVFQRIDKLARPGTLLASNTSSMVNEAALLLEEGVAARGPDVDVMLANGYGFPRNQGWPIDWARSVVLDTLSRYLAWLAEVSGTGFHQCDVVPVALCDID